MDLHLPWKWSYILHMLNYMLNKCQYVVIVTVQSTGKKQNPCLNTHTHTHPHFSHQWKPNNIKHLGSFSPCLKVRLEEINLKEKEGAKSHWLHPQTPRKKKRIGDIQITNTHRTNHYGVQAHSHLGNYDNQVAIFKIFESTKCAIKQY